MIMCSHYNSCCVPGPWSGHSITEPFSDPKITSNLGLDPKVQKIFGIHCVLRAFACMVALRKELQMLSLRGASIKHRKGRELANLIFRGY